VTMATRPSNLIVIWSFLLLLFVMPGHSRLKDCVTSARLCPGIHQKQ